jgi:hypothetical protein
LLESTRLVLEDGKLRLILPSDGTAPLGEAVERRFQALAEACGADSGRIEL